MQGKHGVDVFIPSAANAELERIFTIQTLRLIVHVQCDFAFAALLVIS